MTILTLHDLRKIDAIDRETSIGEIVAALSVAVSDRYSRKVVVPASYVRALIASWRELGEALNRMRAAYEGPQLAAQNAALKDKP